MTWSKKLDVKWPEILSCKCRNAELFQQENKVGEIPFTEPSPKAQVNNVV